jgi:hypothetical protein
LIAKKKKEAVAEDDGDTMGPSPPEGMEEMVMEKMMEADDMMMEAPAEGDEMAAE